MWHEQVRELAQAVMAQRTEVEVFLVSSLQLVSVRCFGHFAHQPCRRSPGACNDARDWCDRTGHLMKREYGRRISPSGVGAP